jgi:hypothetical protein
MSMNWMSISQIICVFLQIASWPNACQPNCFFANYMSAKCLIVKCLSAKCLLAKCLSAKWFSIRSCESSVSWQTYHYRDSKIYPTVVLRRPKFFRTNFHFSDFFVRNSFVLYSGPPWPCSCSSAWRPGWLRWRCCCSGSDIIKTFFLCHCRQGAIS